MRTSLAIAVVASFLVLPSCVSRTAYMAQVNKVKGLNASLDQLTQYLKQYDSDNEKLVAENAGFRRSAGDLANLREQKAKLARLLKGLEKAGGGIDIEGVKAIHTKEGVGLRIDDAVLFASGQATLSPQGKATVGKILPLLQRDAGQERAIRIDGHSDSDPIRKSAWASNLHLSAARALAVAKELSRRGFSSERIQVRGLGSSKPLSKIPSEKARNRRVELFFVQD